MPWLVSIQSDVGQDSSSVSVKRLTGDQTRRPNEHLSASKFCPRQASLNPLGNQLLKNWPLSNFEGMLQTNEDSIQEIHQQ